MTAAGWQDDTRFAISLARTRACNGYGPLRIRAELATHRLAPEAIAAAFAALADAGEDDWPALARDLVRRRLGTDVAGSITLRRKAADLLMRRGFDGDSMRAAIRQDRGRLIGTACATGVGGLTATSWPRPLAAC